MADTPRPTRIRGPLIAWVVLALLALLLLTNTVVTDRETRDAHADIGRLVEVGGRELHVREDGSPARPPIVLIHGLAGSIHLWDRLLPRLTDRYRVIRFDLLGHGGSEKPRDGYGPDEQAELLGELLDRLHVHRALVVGHSLGGMIGVALAERRPDLFRGFVAIGTPARPGDVDLPLTARMGTWPVVGELVHRTVTDGMVKDALGDALGDDVAVPRQFVEDYREMTYSAFRGSYNEPGEWADDKPLDQRIAQTGVPILAVMGAEDKEVKRQALGSWGDVPRAKTRLLSEMGHTPQWEAPVRIAALLIDFDRDLNRR